MAENVRVVVRCRPMNKREHQLKCRTIVEIDRNCSVSVQNPADPNAPAKTFTFDNVYDGMSPTESIYNDICYSLVENVLEGYNGTIFAYGQTGCGKTHTMQGPDLDNLEVPSEQRGIISRTFDHIFEAISVASGVRYLALVSYLEIYNENIRDLLNPNEGVNANHPLKELPGVGVSVPSVSTHTVRDAQQCNRLLHMGNRNRIVAATLMNDSSSRSHSIFSISLEQIQNADVEKSDVATGTSGIRRGKLNLVDLAGSERQNKTGASGERLKEATKINLSLSALGNVISALVDGKTKHIPYRDSKLTRLLQDSLGGNTKTLMISCISPADNNYDETLSTLRYASRAKNIANKPRINEDPKDAKIREYQQEILKLKQLLDSTSIGVTEVPQPTLIEPENWVSVKNQGASFVELDKPGEQPDEPLSQAKATPNMDVEMFDEDPEREVLEAGDLQMEARKRIEMIKRALIGGERANDVKLRERRQKKKIDAQRRLSALAHALSRVEEEEDRDLLQGHYANIKQELNAKNEYLKAYRHKIKALEREVSDVQAEFQLDRADYLETIRRLERNLKFFQQLMDKALPILRRDGKYWDPSEIMQTSHWNDDLKVWKLPETTMWHLKLPPATSALASTTKMALENGPPALRTMTMSNDRHSDVALEGLPSNVAKKSEPDVTGNNSDIVNNYFRSTRQHTSDVSRQRRGFNCWRDITWRQNNVATANNDQNVVAMQNTSLPYNFMDHKRIQSVEGRDGAVFSSRLQRKITSDSFNPIMNKTWSFIGGTAGGTLSDHDQQNVTGMVTKGQQTSAQTLLEPERSWRERRNDSPHDSNISINIHKKRPHRLNALNMEYNT